MAFEQYPYTNFHDLNLDWILAEVKRVSEAVDHWGEEVLAQANAYTDSKVGASEEKMLSLFEEFKAATESANSAFQQSVNGSLQQFQLQINEQNKRLEENLAAARGYTDTRIEQNNQYIFDKIDTGLIDVKVLNIFTGEYVSVQEMLNYLATFHLTGAISIAEIARLVRTVNAVVGYNETVTNIVINGRAIFEESA